MLRYAIRRLTFRLCPLLVLLTFLTAPAAVGGEDAGESPDPAARILLWPDTAPVGDGTREKAETVLSIFLPPREKATGAAIVICPGGGYMRLVLSREGPVVAKWLAEHGIAGAVLEYRMPDGRPFVPLLDAQRAIRVVRSNAEAWQIDPKRIGIMGFSAGGHLASTAGTHFDAGDPQADDPIDRQSCRPDFMVLVYPVVTMREKTHGGSKKNLLGPDPKPELVALFSNEEQVTDQTPPTFLAHAKDDVAVPPENSRALRDALKAHGIPVEYLELPEGGHGLFGCKGPLWEAWKAQSLEWMAAQGIIPQEAAVASQSVPPEYVGAPSGPRAVTNRAFTGIPSMAVTPGGRLWATWYAGPTPAEDHNNYVVLSTSGDDGETWNEVLVVDPDADGPRRAFDPELWLAPNGKLRWSWSDRTGGDSKTDGLWTIVLADPESAQSPRSEPECIATGVMMCKPLVLSTGEWALPVCTWFTEQSSKMIVSADAGKTWSIRGGATAPKEVRLFDEHMFIERKNGSLWVLSRTKYGIGEAVSTDRGATWTDLKPSKLQHPSARFFIRRLASGNLLLVKHGPLYQKTGRSHLTAYLSKDDGATWQGGLLLDERGGVSYPDGQQDRNGLIRVIYDFSRTGERLILMVSFREDDVLSGRTDSESVRLRRLVSKGTGGREKAPAR